MADPDRALYNFYFRYKWNEVDFAGWQDGMIGILRDTMGTIFGPAVISGGLGTAGGGMSVNVAPFIAVAPSGYLNVKNTVTNVLVTSDPTNPRKDLIVARKSLVDNTFITRPTSPFDSVPLKQLQETQCVRIAGTPAGSPVYPAKLADDVILFGVNIAAAASSIVNGNVDQTVTELISGNTNFSNWVVGKDVKNTAAVTAASGSTRAAITGTGEGSHEGLKGVGGATGDGVVGEGGATGSGVTGTSGATAGHGVNGICLNAEEYGVVGQNQAGGVALAAIGDATLPARGAFFVSPQNAQPTGPNAVGDMYVTTAGVLKICTAAGTPGTWTSVGAQT